MSSGGCSISYSFFFCSRAITVMILAEVQIIIMATIKRNVWSRLCNVGNSIASFVNNVAFPLGIISTRMVLIWS